MADLRSEAFWVLYRSSWRDVVDLPVGHFRNTCQVAIRINAAPPKAFDDPLRDGAILGSRPL